MGPTTALLSLLALSAVMQGSYGRDINARIIGGQDFTKDSAQAEKQLCDDMGLIGYFFNYNKKIGHEPTCHGVYVEVDSNNRYILGGSCVSRTAGKKPGFLGLRGKKLFGGCTADGGKATVVGEFYRVTPGGVTKDYLEGTGCTYAKSVQQKADGEEVDYDNCFVLSYARPVANITKFQTSATRQELKQRRAQKIDVRFTLSTELCTSELQAAGAKPTKYCFVRKTTGSNCEAFDTGAPLFCKKAGNDATEADAFLVGFNADNQGSAKCDANKLAFYVDMLETKKTVINYETGSPDPPTPVGRK